MSFIEAGQTSPEGGSLTTTFTRTDVGLRLRVRPNITPENNVDITINPVTITMDVDKFVVVYFQTEATTVTLTLSINGQGTIIPTEGEHTYNTGETATLTATPAIEWFFVAWIVDLDFDNPLYDNPLPLSMIADYDVLCVFSEIQTYELTITSSSRGQTTPSEGTYTYEQDETLTVSASANRRYRFRYWRR